MLSTQEIKDIETGVIKNKMNNTLMLESPRIKWAFIRKVYFILAVQLIVAFIVASVVNFVPFVKHFIVTTALTRTGTVLFILLNILPLFVLLLLYFCRATCPFNFLLLFVFTLALSFMVGSKCASGHGDIILQVILLLLVVVVSLTLYTIWAAKIGYDFKFLGPFFFAATFLVISFFLVQMLFPLGIGIKIIFELVVGLVFCAYVVYDTSILIKTLSSGEYIWGSARVHLDIVPIIISFVTCKRAGYH